ncbi:MAG: trehalose-6-phosphate synthase, partial [Pseudomonadota bacterium]|nr:trehalose-6-phosphate synthase [Pseudomonadota bacterium]
LSNLAGAACELTAALQINPYDPRALGHALQTALTMPLGERRERHVQLLVALRESSIDVWVDRFLAALKAAPRAPFARLAG